MNDDIREGFIRQRRNLALMSCVVFFSETANLKFEKINIFGNETIIGNPYLVNLFLWILLVYWLVRYYQYSRELGDKGFLSSFKLQRIELVKKAAFRKLLSNSELTKFYLDGENEGRTIYPREFEIYQDELFLINGKVEFLVGENKGSGTIHGEEYIFKWKELIFPSLLSFVHVNSRTRYFSEYILPYVLFFIAVIFSSEVAKEWLKTMISP